MSIFTRTTDPASTEPPPQAPVDLDERPELWIPDHLRDEFDAVARTRRSTITQYAHPTWLAELAGNPAASFNGKPNGLIHEQLTFALAHLRFDGIVPRHSPWRISIARFVDEPLQGQEGNKYIVSTQRRPAPRSEEEQEQLNRERYVEDHREEFEALLDSTARDVLADAVRSWEAFVHITLISLTVTAIRERNDAAKREADRLRIMCCPVCGEDNGAIAHRPLLPDQKPKGAWSKSPTVRTCLHCWHEAVAQTRANRATLADGRKRADIVAAYLAGK